MVKIEILERVAVTRQEFLDAKRRRGAAGPDQQRVANPLRLQGGPAMNQRAHQLFAYLGMLSE